MELQKQKIQNDDNNNPDKRLYEIAAKIAAFCDELDKSVKEGKK